MQEGEEALPTQEEEDHQDLEAEEEAPQAEDPQEEVHVTARPLCYITVTV
jgi:hypothetical protein